MRTDRNNELRFRHIKMSLLEWAISIGQNTRKGRTQERGDLDGDDDITILISFVLVEFCFVVGSRAPFASPATTRYSQAVS